MSHRILASGACWTLLCALASAQGPAFQTPGMPTYATQQNPVGDTSQADRFTSGFNPAFSFVIDTLADYIDSDADTDGFDAHLRVLELAANSWVDPNAWAYFVAAADEESLNVEEAAVHYIGLGQRTTVRAGRFFIDFGKQMQTHVHELRTVERPLVLRTYLGEEVKGDGVQLDQWFPVGDKTAVRASLGGFANLLPEESPDFLPVAPTIADRKSLGDFNYTGRLTGFTDVGESAILQLGTSVRGIPSFTFEDETSGATAEELSNTVYGFDATFGWTDETGQKKWTFGGEYLLDQGDNGAAIDDSGTPEDPADDAVTVLTSGVGGYFVFGDYAWSAYNSVGIQYSALTLPDDAKSDESEVEAYWSHSFSEFHRLRFAVSSFSTDVPDSDSVRFVLQYTATLGAHGHGVNW